MRPAKIISTVLHPIFLPTYMMLVMVASGVTRFTPGNDLFFIATTLFVTCLFPGLIIVMMRRWRIIDSLEMDNRDDRLGPIFLTTLSLYGAIRLFRNIQLMALFNVYLSSTLVISVLAFIVTFFWKISLHMLGWGGFVSCLFFMAKISASTFLPYFLAGMILSGIVASARMKEKSHDAAQLIAGFIAGSAVVIVLYYLVLNQ